MIGVIVVALLVVPVVELWLILQVAGAIGIPETVVLLVVISIAGAWLLRQQGTATWRRLQATLGRGQVPTREIVDGALILFGGALLLTPGFFSDAVGLMLLFPPTRGLVKGAATGVMARAARRRLARTRGAPVRVIRV